MKLIDMLVEDGLNGWRWPDGIKCITQDNGSPIYKGVAFGYYREPILRKNIWLAANGTGHADVRVKNYDVIADDWATAIITREQYEAALADKNDGWIDWGGGECPVPRGTLVDVRYRGGNENHQVGAGAPFDDTGSNPERNATDWENDDSPLDIIAYRLHKPQEAIKADDEADLNECIGQDVAPAWSGEGLPPVGCECEYISNGTSWGKVKVIGFDGEKIVIRPSGEIYYAITPSNKDVFTPFRSEADKKREEVIMSLAGSVCSAHFTYGEKLSDGQLLGSMWYELYDAIAAGKVRGVKLED